MIVAANGAAITGPEQLASAVRKSGAALELTVRDSRTGATAGASRPGWINTHSPAAAGTCPSGHRFGGYALGSRD